MIPTRKQVVDSTPPYLGQRNPTPTPATGWIMLRGILSYLWPRAVIALALVVIANYFIRKAGTFDHHDEPDLYLNIGSEILGIVITVAFIEFYFAWQRRRAEAKNLAWRILYELDHVVWLWQGGYPTFNFDELRGIVQGIKPTDTLVTTTLDSIVRLGNTAESARLVRGRLANLIPDLELALEGLAELANRERFSSVQKLDEDDIAEIRERLLAAVGHLARAVGENDESERTYEGIPLDSSKKGQSKRLQGLMYLVSRSPVLESE